MILRSLPNLHLFLRLFCIYVPDIDSPITLLSRGRETQAIANRTIVQLGTESNVPLFSFSQQWIEYGAPKSFWISGFFYPQGMTYDKPIRNLTTVARPALSPLSIYLLALILYPDVCLRGKHLAKSILFSNLSQ